MPGLVGPGVEAISRVPHLGCGDVQHGKVTEAAIQQRSAEAEASPPSAVGWPDQNYFARRFKAHYGLSATTYRKRFATGPVHLRDA